MEHFGILALIPPMLTVILTIGACMRPVCDEKKVPRAKLAYILDSTATPVCILAPISSWVVTVMSYTKSSQGFASHGINEFQYFIRTIPYNLYAIFAIIMVAAVSFKGTETNAKWFDFLIPLVILIITAVFFFPMRQKPFSAFGTLAAGLSESATVGLIYCSRGRLAGTSLPALLHN
ncbi:MAG: hypothetical protein LLF89_07990 [Spirochaetaceae bacterium]|nr:hypothetical protein [Spirochaetaceae bacterium]